MTFDARRPDDSSVTNASATMSGAVALAPRAVLHVVRELLPEEPHRRQHLVGAAEPAERDVAEAAAHRVADDKRARQHRHGRRHAEHHREVRAPVIGRAPGDEG